MSMLREILEGRNVRNVVENYCVNENYDSLDSDVPFSVAQLLNVYEGKLEIHGKNGLMYKLPLDDEDAGDKKLVTQISVTITRPIKKLERYSDCLVVYI